MNKKELIQAAAEHSGMPQGEVEKVLNSVLESIKKSLKEEEPVTLVGFGTFMVMERSERVGHNPSTGQKMQIPAKKVVKFKPGKSLEIEQENK